MSRMFVWRRWIVGTVVAAAGLCGGGCQSNSTAEQSQEENRKLNTAGKVITFLSPQIGGALSGIAQSNEADAEKAMRRPLSVAAIQQLVDHCSAELAVKINANPKIKGASDQNVLAFMPVRATTRGGEDLSAVLDGLNQRLSENEAIRHNFRILSTTQENANDVIRKLAGRDLSGFRDPLGRTPDRTTAEAYDPSQMYVVDGTLGYVVDHNARTCTYTLTVRFHHVQTRELVTTSSMSKTYQWHMTNREWALRS